MFQMSYRFLNSIINEIDIKDSVESVEAYTSGRVNHIYRVNMKNSNTSYIVKIRDFNNESFQQNFCNEITISKKHCNIKDLLPEVYISDIKGDKFGVQYAIMSYVPGTTLEKKKRCFL